jgi:hypothetical protein
MRGSYMLAGQKEPGIRTTLGWEDIFYSSKNVKVDQKEIDTIFRDWCVVGTALCIIESLSWSGADGHISISTADPLYTPIILGVIHITQAPNHRPSYDTSTAW